MEFRLPDLGEGIESGTVTRILVKAGDTLTAGQLVIAVETDKAAVDIPVETAGTVSKVHVKEGDKVSIGAPILTLTGAAATTTSAPAQPKPATSPPPASSTPQSPPPPVAPPTPGVASKVDVILPVFEGVDYATISHIYVKPGDAVKAGNDLVTVETDKASGDLPAEMEGVVEAVHVKRGDRVKAGEKLVTITTTAAALTTTTTPTAPPPETLVVRSPERVRTPSLMNTENGTATKTIIPAGPATRRLARELSVGLAEVKGSGRGGRVTIDDVKGFVRTEREQVKKGGGVVGGSIVNAFTLPPFRIDPAKFGPVEVQEVTTIRQTIAKNLTVGWRTMPMVTQHDLADITELEGGRKRIVAGLAAKLADPKKGPKITWTVLAIKACVAVLKEFPRFNSTYDMNAGKLIIKKYYHIGIAVDTERGLVVPVIKDADKKSILDLAAAVADLAEKAKTGKLPMDAMQGGSFTISNLGGIGGTAFTPIVNYPEVAILGLSKSTLQPVVKDGAIVPRLMMPLSLTYDHRVIDGADGCRFTVRLAQLFSDPLRLLMET